MKKFFKFVFIPLGIIVIIFVLFISKFQWYFNVKKSFSSNTCNSNLALDYLPNNRVNVLTGNGIIGKHYKLSSKCYNNLKGDSYLSSETYVLSLDRQYGVTKYRNDMVTLVRYKCLGQKSFSEDEQKTLKKEVFNLMDNKSSSKNFLKDLNKLAKKHDCFVSLAV